MEQLKKYKYQSDKPLSEPYDKDGIFNAFYKGFQIVENRDVLVSEFRQPKYQRLYTKQKRLLKLKAIVHKNISQIYDVILDKDSKKMFVILEWCKGGNLYDYQKSNSSIDCGVAVKILASLMNGLRQLHKADEMHRYINMENVQFDETGTPKLTFRCLYPKTYYLSPEDKQGNRTKQSDLFSLGVLFYKLLLGQTPFKGNSLDQQLRNVQEGPKFPKNDKQLFPLSLPIQVKNLIVGMTMFKSEERLTDDFVIESCQKFLQKSNNSCGDFPYDISDKLKIKIFTQQYIPIYTRKKSQQQYVFIVLCPTKHEFNKFHIYKSKSKNSLVNYVADVLEPFRQIKNQMDIVPIYENYIVDDQYLVIRTFYDNQGSLKYYLNNSGTILPEYSKQFSQQLKEKLHKYGKAHNYLTSDNILIRGGDFYVNYPPFLTKQFINQLKNERKQIGMIAPEVKEGKNSQNGDAWSVAMLQYFVQNSELPKFDKNGKVIIPNKSYKSQEQIKFYQDNLVQDPQKRKPLFIQQIKQQLIKQQPSVPQISQINIVTSRKKKTEHPIDIPKIKIPRQQKKTIGKRISQNLQLFQQLEKSWTKPVRVGLKCILGTIMLLFLFYFSFFLINGQLIAQHSLYQSCPVSIRAFPSDATPYLNYTLVTKNSANAKTLFYNQTVSILRDNYVCVLNDYSVDSNVVEVLNQSGFRAYQVIGILLSIFNLIIFCVSLSKMDFPKVFFICRLDENNFNEIWNWMFINMALASQISCIYLLYGSLFHLTLEPCLSKATLTAVQFLFKKWYFSFNIRFIWIYLGLIFSYMVIIFFIIKPKYEVHKLIKAGLVALYLTGVFIRIMGGSGGYIAWQKQSVFGKLGQLLLLMISVVFLLIDVIFGCVISKENEVDKANPIEQSQSDIYHTQQNLLPN